MIKHKLFELELAREKEIYTVPNSSNQPYTYKKYINARTLDRAFTASQTFRYQNIKLSPSNVFVYFLCVELGDTINALWHCSFIYEVARLRYDYQFTKCFQCFVR